MLASLLGLDEDVGMVCGGLASLSGTRQQGLVGLGFGGGFRDQLGFRVFVIKCLGFD